MDSIKGATCTTNNEDKSVAVLNNEDKSVAVPLRETSSRQVRKLSSVQRYQEPTLDALCHESEIFDFSVQLEPDNCVEQLKSIAAPMLISDFSSEKLYSETISKALDGIQDPEFYSQLQNTVQYEILLSMLYQPASDTFSIHFLNSQAQIDSVLMASIYSQHDYQNRAIKNKALYLFTEGRFELLNTLIQKGLNLTNLS
ncbi:MAG: hypothetical protein HAW62_03395, partial [Endozoicomonadaceae bacterium]|nr:hypothetical protein [Endozoicomonadaceae bacterium]